jgi:DNA topoisomerase-1
LPKHLLFETVKLEDATNLLSMPKEIGETSEDEKVTVNLGPYGPYLKVDKINIPLPKDMDPFTVKMEDVTEVIVQAKERKKKEAEPLKTFGDDPNTKKPILIKDGRYGPYVTDGITNASISKKKDPMEITYEEAIEMLEKKRKAPKRGWGRRKKA